MGKRGGGGHLGKRPSKRLRMIRKDNIKIDVRDRCCDMGGKWNYLNLVFSSWL
jgi:hypothetical protein